MSAQGLEIDTSDLRERFPVLAKLGRALTPARIPEVRQMGTTFGWRMRAERRASSTNMSQKARSFADCGCITLTATVRENPRAPTSRPRYTVAIPPVASSLTTS